MARQRRWSLYLAVVPPVVGVVLASMGIVAYSAMHLMRESVQAVAEQRARFLLAHTRNTIDDIEHVMMVETGRKLKVELERLGQSPDAGAIRVLSVEGKVLHSSSSAEVGSMMPAHLSAVPDPLPADRSVLPSQVREVDGLLHADAPILNHRRCTRCHGQEKAILGVVDVDISLARQTAGMRTWAGMVGIASVLQFAVIALGVVLVLGFVVVNPIRRLERSMREVRLGNYSVAADPAVTRELDTLVSGFNDMVGRLRRADEIEQAAQRTKMARAEQMAKLGEWAAGLAHELRNPLSGIKAAVDVLAGEEPDEEPRKILKHVSSELGRVDGVVRQFLNLAKPKAPDLRRVDVRSALDDTVKLSRPRAGARGARLDTAFPVDPVEVVADLEMVQQVVLNLILNALDATERVTDPQVVVSVEARDNVAWCRVRDNGPGVPADQAPWLFRPFATTKARGTGLGLATSLRLVELQGGQLRLENPGEPGASFAFSLPLFSGAPPGVLP